MMAVHDAARELRELAQEAQALAARESHSPEELVAAAQVDAICAVAYALVAINETLGTRLDDLERAVGAA